MGQKVNPVGFRTGIMIGWKSRWYASKQEFCEPADRRLTRSASSSRTSIKFAGIPKIEIERTRDEVKVMLHTARPGVIIGRKGQEVERLQDELQELVGRRINIKIEEIARPEIRGPAGGRGHRRAVGQAGQLPPHDEAGDRNDDGSRRQGDQDSTGRPAGRSGNGAPRKSRSPARMPLSTLRAKIDYGFTEAMTAQGHIGVQVWINQGMYHEDADRWR